MKTINPTKYHKEILELVQKNIPAIRKIEIKTRKNSKQKSAA